MPIKPENRSRYPADWPAIRERILLRAGYTCEHPGCMARQYAVGKWLRLTSGDQRWMWHEWAAPLWWGTPTWAKGYRAARQHAAELWHAQGEEGVKPIVIVLTIAHLDHRPENCADDNLRALCQRHHLAHDHAHHMANAQATRRARSGTAELFT